MKNAPSSPAFPPPSPAANVAPPGRDDQPGGSRPPVRPTATDRPDASTAAWQASQRRLAWTLHGMFLLIALGVLAVAFFLRIDADGHVATPWGARQGSGLPALCMFRHLFSLECPGCGLTRCFVSAADGNLAQAWMFHPTGVLLFGLLVAQIPYRTLQLVRLRRGQAEISAHPWAPWLAGAIGALMIGQWVVRMIA